MPPPPRILVTAGNTREAIDRVRDWGNVFTGNTGFAIARAGLAVGEVHLLTSNAAHRAEAAALGIKVDAFSTHADLLALLEARVRPGTYDAIFMTAAVADYRPTGTFAVDGRETLPDGTERWTVRNVQAGKVKSTHNAIAVLGEPTQKIIDRFRHPWGHRGLLVKFKLEVDVPTETLIEIGQASRRASGAEYLVANSLDMVSGEAAGAFLLSDASSEWVPRGELAQRCARLIESVATPGSG
ncbi:MAG TPA: phosphopantothenoylcysteine decarboxylase [Tepidisphaeraceae bacterium]